MWVTIGRYLPQSFFYVMQYGPDLPPAGFPASSRRAVVLALLGAAGLAGCASQPGRSKVVATGRLPSDGPAPQDRYALSSVDPDRITGRRPTGRGRGISVQRDAVVANAMMLINTPYTWGGNTPEGGFDCSGLVQYVFARVMPERSLPRTTADWAQATTPIADARRQRGDLVFFNTSGRRFSHMGILIDDQVFVHAPSSGGRVHKTPLSNPYFSKRYLGARRVFEA